MVLILIGNGLSYRTSAKRLGMSKNTVTGIVKRHHCPEPAASAYGLTCVNFRFVSSLPP